jgi:four helix bundle protein
MRNFRHWEVYKNSKSVCVTLYKVTEALPSQEKFGLISQIRRAAVSIVANIAEGAGRRSEKDFRHFLSMAIGSSFEVEALLDLSLELGFFGKDELLPVQKNLEIVQKQLNAFISKLGD